MAAAPTPSFAVGDATIVEGNEGIQYAAVYVSLSAATAKTVQVSYSTVDGTARAGSDYTAASGTLTFAPGEISKSILLPVKGDRVGEVNESFFINLSGAKGTKIADAQGIVAIMEDEPIIGIFDAGGCKGADTTAFTFTVYIPQAYDQPVTVAYTTRDGTAIAGVDYSATFGTLTFSPGETSKNISVAVLGDPIEGPGTKAFYVALSGTSSNAIVNPYASTGTGTIIQSARPPDSHWDSTAFGTGGWVGNNGGDPNPGSSEAPY